MKQSILPPIVVGASESSRPGTVERACQRQYRELMEYHRSHQVSVTEGRGKEESQDQI